MMKKYHISAIFRILFNWAVLWILTSVFPGCSDNNGNGLYAGGDFTLNVITADQDLTTDNELLLGSEPSSTVITVSGGARFEAVVSECIGSWCKVTDIVPPKDNNSLPGYFTVMVNANRNSTERECMVTVYAVEEDGTRVPGHSFSFRVSQELMNIEIEGNIPESIPWGGTVQTTRPSVTVTSALGWEVSCSESWLSIVPGEKMDGNTFTPQAGSKEKVEVIFQLSVQPNLGAERTAEVEISSRNNAFTARHITVTQEGSSEEFFISPTSVPIINYNDTVINFEIYSPYHSWTTLVAAPGAEKWLTLEPASGDASIERVIVKAIIEANPDTIMRKGGFVFIRKDNDNTTMGETTLTLTQIGKPRVYVSKAWIINDWTTEAVELQAVYDVATYSVVGGGAFYQSINSAEPRRVDYKECDNGILTVLIEGLEPDTEYKAWPYIQYKDGEKTDIIQGESISFTTPKQNGEAGGKPDPGDNIPPDTV